MELWIEFTRPHKWSLQSLVIRLFTWSKFSHCRCRLVFNNESWVFETNPPKSRFLKDEEHRIQFPAKVVKTLQFKLSDEEIEKMYDFIHANKNKSYDWGSVLKIGLVTILPFTKKMVYDYQSNIKQFFCSELCLALYETVKNKELSSYDESVGPQKLYKILLKEYEDNKR